MMKLNMLQTKTFTGLEVDQIKILTITLQKFSLSIYLANVAETSFVMSFSCNLCSNLPRKKKKKLVVANRETLKIHFFNIILINYIVYIALIYNIFITDIVLRRSFIWRFSSKAFMKEHLYSCSFVSIVTALALSHCLENKRPLTQYKSFTKNSTAKPTTESGVLVDLRMAMGHYSYLHLNSPLPWTSPKVLIRPVLPSPSSLFSLRFLL